MSVTTQSGSVISAVIQTWKNFGVFDFILPFLLVFAIVYGILERVQIFGAGKGSRIHGIIAFTMAMITTLTSWFISFLTGFMPWVSVISIVIITALMLVAMFYTNFETLISGDKLKWMTYLVFIAMGIVLLVMGGQQLANLNINISGILASVGLSITDVWGLVFFVGFIVVLWVIGRPEGGGSNKPPAPPKTGG